ncbi:nucleotidyltransferase domain-containing protein [Comamonas terrigena]|uniref:nucleotidyltransferase domain-containing protein n=1 Tax=Comamonas terrigena TaxID=32013 RepID=UPI002446B42E|nr:nucleotidyltransferase domain-containing protein [Comamonas terrigena]MDH1703158.1 nucleotidyltransferase domain-containing protein [Comamonas terrigena]
MTSRHGTTTPPLLAIHPHPPLQAEFADLVSDARNSLCQQLGTLLDSLYLYGSVSRATATPGTSDLDLTLVLRRPLTAHEAQALEHVRTGLQARHPEVTKVDLDLGSLAQVLDAANLYSWGYWLKHVCRCIHGTDLGQRFPAFRPSPAIAQAINGDYAQVLHGYAERIAQAQSLDAMHRLQKEAARKLVRATHVLRPGSDGYWPETLEDYASYGASLCPGKAQEIAFFLEHARSPWAPGDVFNDKLLRFTDWLQHTQRLAAPA